jgi:isopentenyl phosphate kinase
VQTNVAGIYDRPPELPGAQLIRSVLVGSDGSLTVAGADGSTLGLDTNVADCDVTGGMGAKVAEAVGAARHVGHAVRIVQAATPHALAACCVELAPVWAGTEVKRRP